MIFLGVYVLFPLILLNLSRELGSLIIVPIAIKELKMVIKFILNIF